MDNFSYEHLIPDEIFIINDARLLFIAPGNLEINDSNIIDLYLSIDPVRDAIFFLFILIFTLL